jgi:hypothetical protein
VLLIPHGALGAEAGDDVLWAEIDGGARWEWRQLTALGVEVSFGIGDGWELCLPHRKNSPPPKRGKNRFRQSSYGGTAADALTPAP